MSQKNLLFYVIKIIFFFQNIDFISSETRNQFLSRRTHFLESEKRLFTGANLTLSSSEKLVNQHLVTLKTREFENETFPPDLHFFYAKHHIAKSQVFDILRKMPKGNN